MRIDLHTHTYPASDCSAISHDEFVGYCRDQRIEAIALTNHGNVHDNLILRARLADAGTVLLDGVEVSTLFGDFVVFSSDLKYLSGLRALRAPLCPEDVPNRAAVVWVHPIAGGGHSGSVYLPGMELQVAPVVHAVEVYNGNWLAQQYVDGAQAIASALGLPRTGGSDAHRQDRLGVCATEVDGPIGDTADLVRALRAGAVQPWRGEAQPRRLPRFR
jgi:predicted metal-dependent phosphoesterase TrpH